ncbi:hypothetical protein BGZ49_010464 [Haplosporangium sp. Z 27]|nr:hypothetical protein BGZ49_010464 [Haplosporangium sp. Z 27]
MISQTGISIEQDQSFVGSENDQDSRDSVGTPKEPEEPNEDELWMQCFGNQEGFPLPASHAGEEFFRTTPFNRINQNEYIAFRYEVAQIEPQNVANEWNKAMTTFRGSNKKTTNILLLILRKIPPKNKRLSKDLVIKCATEIGRLYPDGVPSSGIDVSAMFQVNTSIMSTVDGESSPSVTPPTTDTESKSTQSSSSHQLSDEKITSAQVIRTEFERNFACYPGRPLILDSKVNVDQVLFKVIRTFGDESLLHSSILDPEGLAWLLRRFHDGDREQLVDIVERLNRDINHVADIEDWKIRVINRFETFSTIQDILFQGWNNMFILEGATPNGYTEFVKMTIDFMNDVLEKYKKFGNVNGEGIELSKELSERSYSELWGVFFQVISKSNGRIKLLEGEVSSTASALRRNAGRTLGDYQKAGHKIDTIFYVSRASDSEFGAVEFGKKNESSYGTKYLVDSVKLSKVLKDMFDCICTRAIANRSNVNSGLKSKLQIYGFLVSGKRLEFWVLRHFGGRFYMTKKISEHVLPAQLHEETFSKIRRLLVEFLMIRVRMEETAMLIVRHVDGDEGSIKTQSGQEFEQYSFHQTLTTPPSSPKPKRAKVSP